MANEHSRNIQDASLNVAAFALPTTDSDSKTSAAVDLGDDVHKTENVEVELLVPALSGTIAPAASTEGATYSIETSTTSTFSEVDQIIASKTIAGDAGGIAETALRARLPSDCARFVRGKVAFGDTMADGSAVSATFSLRF